MKVVPVKTLKEFSIRHPQSGRAIALIINDLKKEFFENVNRLKDHFPYISVLKDNRVVFNVSGNKYRLVLKINYNAQIAKVMFVGTHAEYDKIDANVI